MTKLDYFLIILTIIAISLILLLLQGVNSPAFFNFLTQLGILENSKNGFKQIFISLLYLTAFIFIIILILSFRFISRMIERRK